MAEAGATEERTLLVGDSIVDYDTARNAGVACCLVTWGFGYSRMPTATLAPGQLVVSDTAALANCIEQFFL
jgi:phosphoglycolate phosphatase-like HAD superfamily hydrolase